MQFSQFKNFLGCAMESGQGKPALTFKHLITMDKDTDG